MPLLLVFALVLFVNTEMWQVFSDVPRAFLAPVFGLFVGLGSLFLVARLPREVDELERDVGEGPPLDRRQRVNVALVMFVAQALQVLVVCVAVAGFFVAFGALTIGPTCATPGSARGQGADHVDARRRERADHQGAAARGGRIAAFSGLYYAIAVLTDTTYREEFLTS